MTVCGLRPPEHKTQGDGGKCDRPTSVVYHDEPFRSNDRPAVLMTKLKGGLIVADRAAHIDKRILAAVFCVLDVVPFRRSPAVVTAGGVHPFPIADDRHVLAVLINVMLVLDKLVLKHLL